MYLRSASSKNIPIARQGTKLVFLFTPHTTPYIHSPLLLQSRPFVERYLTDTRRSKLSHCSQQKQPFPPEHEGKHFYPTGTCKGKGKGLSTCRCNLLNENLPSLKLDHCDVREDKMRKGVSATRMVSNIECRRPKNTKKKLRIKNTTKQQQNK